MLRHLKDASRRSGYVERISLVTTMIVIVMLIAGNVKGEVAVSLDGSTNHAVKKSIPKGPIDGLWYAMINDPINAVYAPFATHGVVVKICYTPDEQEQRRCHLVSSSFGRRHSFNADLVAALANGVDTTSSIRGGATSFASMITNVMHGILHSADSESNFQYRSFGNARQRFQSELSILATNRVAEQASGERVIASITDMLPNGQEFREAGLMSSNISGGSGYGQVTTEHSLAAFVMADLGYYPSTAPATTPAPATLAVLGLGLAGLGLARARRKKQFFSRYSGAPLLHR